jgi:hypothetical protein
VFFPCLRRVAENFEIGFRHCGSVAVGTIAPNEDLVFEELIVKLEALKGNLGAARDSPIAHPRILAIGGWVDLG